MAEPGRRTGAALGVGAAGVITYLLLPGALARDVVYQLVGLGAVGAVLVGVRRHRPRRPTAWYLVAAGLLAWSVADAVDSWRTDVLARSGFPTVADAWYLAGYPLVGAGLVRLIVTRRAHLDRAALLDSATLTVALGVLSWVLLARPTVAAFAAAPAAAVVAAAYPAADLVLVALLITLVTTSGGRTRSYRWLAAGVALLVVADTTATAAGLLVDGTPVAVDALWLAAYVSWGVAALDPSMSALTEPGRRTAPVLSQLRRVALAVAVLVAPGTLAVQQLAGRPLDVWAVVIGSVVVFGLVLARVDLAVRQIRAVHLEREAARDELAHRAAHDGLTGLANRAQALVLIGGALARARRSGQLVGVLFIDLDGFKQVNDTLGHHAGDEVLRAVAARMVTGVRPGDAVARLGGDEFVVLLEPLDHEPDAVAVAERMVALVAEPIPLDSGRQARIGASVGVSLNVDGGLDPDRLLAEADHAVYRAKAAGRGCVRVFASSLRAELDRRSAVEGTLARLLRADDVPLRREAIVELAGGEVVGHELEPVLPGADGTELRRAAFLDVVDGTDLGCELDAWVLRHAGRGDQLRAVPVTGRHLTDQRFVADLAAAVEAGVRPESLLLVLPAAEALDELRVQANLAAARQLGVLVCGDGFGAGASPTDRWAQLPFDYVRLDAGLLAPGFVPILLRLTVDTAHAFGYQVIAPEVSHPEQLEVLAAVGCELGQGPLVAAGTAALRTAEQSLVPG